MKNYRHGDLALIGLADKPDTTEKPQQVLHGGSHGHPHSIVGGVFYPERKDDNVLGYLEVNDGGYLTHKEHGLEVEGSSLKQAPLEAGWYEVRVQVEHTNEGMKEVVD